MPTAATPYNVLMGFVCSPDEIIGVYTARQHVLEYPFIAFAFNYIEHTSAYGVYFRPLVHRAYTFHST